MLDIIVDIVDDHEVLLRHLGELLRYEGINTRLFSDMDEFLENNKLETLVCIIDYHFVGKTETGLDLMKKIKEMNSSCKVILISAHIEFYQYIKANNDGAYKFLEKTDPNFSVDIVRYVKAALAEVKQAFEFYGELYVKLRKSEDRSNQMK